MSLERLNDRVADAFDFVLDQAGCFVFLVIGVAFLWFAVWVWRDEEKTFQQWNAECLKDHKQYECTALWRGGNRSVSTVPVVVRTP